MAPGVAGDREDLPRVRRRRPAPAPGSGDGEERHERHALLAAGAQELVLPGGDGPGRSEFCTHTTGAICLGLGQVLRAGRWIRPRWRISPASRSSASAPKCSAIESSPVQAQVHQVQAVAAELAQVLLDLPAQLGRGA